MSVPVPGGQPDTWQGLGKARCGKRNRPWSAGASAGALATGLAQGAWMLRQLAVTVSCGIGRVVRYDGFRHVLLCISRTSAVGA